MNDGRLHLVHCPGMRGAAAAGRQHVSASPSVSDQASYLGPVRPARLPAAPSVIRLRIDRATAKLATERVVLVLDRCREDLENGAMVSTHGARVRVRRLVATRRDGTGRDG